MSGKKAREKRKSLNNEVLDPKFYKAKLKPETAITYEQLQAKGNNKMTREEFDKWNEEYLKSIVYKSSTHLVYVKEYDNGVIHLSIKRNDKEPMGDWRIKQLIKNIIVGDEAEAVEIYPPESELVDEANQYHLWVLPEGERTPFGIRQGRMVSDIVVGNEKQRKGVEMRTFDTGIYKRRVSL